MLKEICLEQFSAEELVRLVYLGESFPRRYTPNEKSHIVNFLKFHREEIKCIRFVRDSRETHVHIELDAMNLSPSDLVLLDKFSIKNKKSC